MQQILLEEIKKRVLPLLSEQGIELVDLLINRGRRRMVLRFLVDKSGGITLDECARLNRELGRVLDEGDIVQQAYLLEVSSPGLDRPIKSTRDFQHSLGKLVRIVLHQPFNGQNVWIGVVGSVDDENVLIRTEKGEELQIARENIAKARLEVKFNQSERSERE